MTNTFKKLIKFITAAVMFVGVGSLGACGPQGDGSIDYVHNGSVKLKLDYKNHDFFEDGIGQVTVLTYIDGDTTHFNNVYGDKSTTLKSRYYGIDTPESTGAVQPFGKKASRFTEEKLRNAAANGTIVVSSPFSTAEDGGKGVYDKPKTDSTGSRYLSLVWINETVKDAPVESLVLLNLWIVQEGLSWAKNTNDVPAYKDVFSDAMNQAERLVRGLWAGEDPDFNYGDYITTSLYDIKKEVMASLVKTDPEQKNKYDGAKVRITGVVSGFVDRMLYLQEKYIFDKETLEPVDDDDYDPAHPEKYIVEWAGINVFCGMTPISSGYTQIGTYLEVCGNAADSDTFGFQISGTQGHWPASMEWEEGDDNCKVILTAEQNDGVHTLQSFDYTASELNANVTKLTKDIKDKNQNLNFDLFCRTNITDELVCSNAYLNSAGDELTLNFKGVDFTAYVPFGYHGNPDDTADSWMDPNKVIGKSFKLSGVFSYHINSSGEIKFQVIVCGDSDLVCTTDKKGTVRTSPLTVGDTYEVSFAENVSYYFRGRATSVADVTALKTPAQIKAIAASLGRNQESEDYYGVKGRIASIDTAWDKAYANISVVIGDSSNSVIVYRAKVVDSIDGSIISAGKEISVVGKVKNFNNTAELVNCTIYNYDGQGAVARKITFTENEKTVEADLVVVNKNYTDSVIVDSYITLFGVPSIKDGIIHFDATKIMSAYRSGTTPEDPLTPYKATLIAGELDEGEESSETYYIAGTVNEITKAYDASTKRISFVVTADGFSYLISGAKFLSGLSPEDLTVGKDVLIRVVLKKVEGVLTTRENGCQIQSIK